MLLEISFAHSSFLVVWCECMATFLHPYYMRYDTGVILHIFALKN